MGIKNYFYVGVLVVSLTIANQASYSQLGNVNNDLANLEQRFSAAQDRTQSLIDAAASNAVSDIQVLDVNGQSLGPLSSFDFEANPVSSVGSFGLSGLGSTAAGGVTSGVSGIAANHGSITSAGNAAGQALGNANSNAAFNRVPVEGGPSDRAHEVANNNAAFNRNGDPVASGSSGPQCTGVFGNKAQLQGCKENTKAAAGEGGGFGGLGGLANSISSIGSNSWLQAAVGAVRTMASGGDLGQALGHFASPAIGAIAAESFVGGAVAGGITTGNISGALSDLGQNVATTQMGNILSGASTSVGGFAGGQIDIGTPSSITSGIANGGATIGNTTASIMQDNGISRAQEFGIGSNPITQAVANNVPRAPGNGVSGGISMSRGEEFGISTAAQLAANDVTLMSGTAGTAGIGR